jgi:hypothetical protein
VCLKPPIEFGERTFKVGVLPAGVSQYSVTTIASRFLDELGPTAPKPVRGKEFVQKSEQVPF